jgi:hypothetical protein
VFLQADEETLEEILEKTFQDGIRRDFFYDDYYSDEFGFTAVAFYPMTKQEGDKYFKGLKLA